MSSLDDPTLTHGLAYEYGSLPRGVALSERVTSHDDVAGLWVGGGFINAPSLQTNIHQRALIDPDRGRVMIDEFAGYERAFHDCTAIALDAGPLISQSAFLLHALPLPWLLASLAPQARLAGAALTPFQIEVLRCGGKLRSYLPLEAPACFQTVIGLEVAPRGQVSRFIRPCYEALRFMAGDAAGPAKLALLAPDHGQVARLRNRSSLTAWLRAMGFEIFDETGRDVEQTIRRMAAARDIVILGEDYAGYLGFCDPAARVIEICPEGWAGTLNRSLCRIFALDWHLCVASAVTYPLSSGLPFGSRHMAFYDIDIARLARALAALG
ncbi:MAG: hypothetical protein B7Z78_10875 [Rhodospirillales bacterium 20-60-12]|nr:MAG: hypothetical protein B7Z78_10875 [Rhodospirillales bacterium 20-60-12]HQT66870.1 hypothetical protein [Acetobacteraceae bacterium]